MPSVKTTIDPDESVTGLKLAVKEKATNVMTDTIAAPLQTAYASKIASLSTKANRKIPKLMV